MDWDSFKEEALHIIGLHMSIMTKEQKENFSRLYSQRISWKGKYMEYETRFCGWNIFKWTTIGEVTFVTMWDEEHLL